MSFPRLLQMERSAGPALLGLRLAPGLSVAEEGPWIWLRAEGGDDVLTSRLRAVPCVARYERIDDGWLRPEGARIPTRPEPLLSWQPIREWLRVGLGEAAGSGESPRPVPLALVRSGGERAANVLVTPLATWASWVETAPEIRLHRLRYAVSSGDEVLIWGEPLPPLPGERFVEQGGVAVPAGWTWRPSVGLEVLRRVLAVGEGMLVLWRPDGRTETLHAEQLVPVRRGGVRKAVAERKGAA